MEYRFLGASGFKVSALGFGAGTFGGKGPLFNAWGDTDVAQARRLVDLCLDAGVNFFDTADVYSDGASETILGAALAGRRDRVVLSTKITLRAGDGPNDVGASRHHLVRGVDRALQRLGTDYIDLLQLHHFDAQTPVESVMSTLDDLVRSGKVLYVGASNFSGWQLMKSQAVADRYGYAKYVAHQVVLLADRPRLRMGADAARPRPGHRRRRVESARLGPAHRPRAPRPADCRRDASRKRRSSRRPSTMQRLHRVIDALDEIAAETGKSIPQIALNWLLQRPTVSTILIGARNEEQLRDNLGAVGWTLSAAQVARLDAASALVPPYPYYPYWNGQFAERNPPPVAVPA